MSPQEVIHFKERGWVVLRQFLPQSDVAQWRTQFWQHMREHYPSFDVDDESSWPEESRGITNPKGNFTVPLGDHPKIVSLVAQLGAGRFSGGSNAEVIVNWPQKGVSDPNAALRDWKSPAGGHIDGYGPGGWSGGFMLLAATYLDEVLPGGGGTHVWDRSHLAVMEYFKRHPEQIDGSFVARDDWSSWSMLYEEVAGAGGCKPVEFVGMPGDLLLIHHYTAHGHSQNARKGKLRVGAFGRWHRPDIRIGAPNNVVPPNFAPLDSVDRREQARYQVPADPWERWSEEVQRAGSGARL